MGDKLVTLTLTGQVGVLQIPPKCWHPQATAPRCGHAASLLLKLGHCSTNTQGQTENLLDSPKLSSIMEKHYLDPLEIFSIPFEFQLHFKIFLIKHTREWEDIPLSKRVLVLQSPTRKKKPALTWLPVPLHPASLFFSVVTIMTKHSQNVHFHLERSLQPLWSWSKPLKCEMSLKQHINVCSSL